MDRKHYFSFLIIITIITQLYSYETVALSSDGSGKTNHPVLFVHGRFSQCPKTYGVYYADQYGKASSFSNIHFRVIYDLDVCSWDRRLVLKNYYIQPISDITFQDGRVLKNEISIVKFKIATRAIKKVDYEVQHIRLDGVNFDQQNDIAVATYTDIANKIDPNKQYTTTISGEIMKGLAEEWTLAEIQNKNWEGKIPGEFNDNYPVERDLVMHYDEGTTPDVIADELGLDVSYLHNSPKAGINSNGIYFFNAKKILTESQVVNGCNNTSVEFNALIASDSVRGPKRWPDGMGQPYLETFYSRFTFDCKVTCHTTGQIVPITFKTFVDSIIKIEWESPKPNMTPTNVSFDKNSGILTYTVHDGEAPKTYTKDIPLLFTDKVEEISEFNDIIYTETGLKNDSTANAYWEPKRLEDSISIYGQPNQLIDRMVEVMNDFYGEGKWEDDPTAVIDIVSNSMGGTTVRTAIEHGSSITLANPLNHINRIIATSSPHLGSAFSTGVQYLNSSDHSGLIELKEHLFNLTPSQDLISIAHVLLPNEAGIFLGTELDIHLDLSLKGNYFGPFDVSGGIYWNHFSKEKKFTFDNTMVEDANKSMFEIRENLMEFEYNAQNMAQEQQSSYTYDLMRMYYPVRAFDGSKIEITNFYINGIPNFLQRVYTAILPQVEGFVSTEFNNSDEMRESEIDPDGATKAVMKALTAEFNRIKDELLNPLDQQWCNKSDMIVDVESQKGLNQFYGFVLDDPHTPFNVKEYTRKSGLAHMGMDLSKISGGEIKYTSGAHEGTDIAGVLLGYTIDVNKYPRPSSAPVSGYMGYSKGTVDEDGKSYLVGYNLQKGDLSYYGGPLTVKYFVKADPSKGPQLEVLSSGGLTLTLDRIGGELYSVTGFSDFVEFNRGGVFPSTNLIEFKLSYADGSAWNPASDWSCYGAEALSENSHLVVWDSTNTKLSGLEPDYSVDTLVTEISLMGDVKAYSKERSYNSSVTQPSLSVQNMGDTVLTGFHAYYYIATSKEPEMKVFWMAEQSKATWELIKLTDTIYAAHIQYDGISVQPGDYFNYIDFEINNVDWSVWNFDDDPSYIDARSLTLNEKVVVTDLSGNGLWGTSPFLPVDGADDKVSSAYITARDESYSADLSSPRIRLFNDGETTLNSLRIYYYFTTEGGKEPVLGKWDVPLCDVNVEALGGNNYRIVYRCTNAGLEPGQELPNMYGSIVGLHYSDWSDWNSSNDYSHGDLSSSFTQTNKIVVEDGKGTLLWGVHPEL